MQLFDGGGFLVAESVNLECEFSVSSLGTLSFRCHVAAMHTLKHYELRYSGEVVNRIVGEDCSSKYCEVEWGGRSEQETSVSEPRGVSVVMWFF